MKFLTIVSGLCLVTSTTFSGTMGEKYRYISPWSFEFGPRYWLSNNTFKHELYGPSKNFLSATGFGGSLLASRITNENLTGNAAEGFWQLKHDNGLFLKGYFGGALLTMAVSKTRIFLVTLTILMSIVMPWHHKNMVLSNILIPT
ncbi:TPA: hypothetical protein I8027_000213 [Legionella pneumophila]|nr:hypothetical protein [Legionella pneumophila]